ncbi:MAG TPA: crosslink repair DNA glycosylase YcaQ family protein [Bryobacteraceae bacterium]|nr:crosslink repair DNA glycosylase YcaQ family protein [Bryobacteraceae bacterium]
MTIADLRRFAIARSLHTSTTLKRAVGSLNFVQADPIRAPARAQDLILHQRVIDYRAGDLERRYVNLKLEEDYFINYGFVTNAVHNLMHPRSGMPPWPKEPKKLSQKILEFVHERGAVHPREVNDHFAHGSTRNYWGGTSNATTHLLDAMHFRGILRVAGRARGIRIYTAREPAEENDDDPDTRIDALIDVVVNQYAPLHQASLANFVSRLRFCVPQWHCHLRSALGRAKQRLAHAHVDGVEWYWPDGERPRPSEPRQEVRLLAPFDPIVWDRRRFELFWGWAYRFEAYTPVSKRKLGYYALPLLWRDRVIGWANVAADNAELRAHIGYVESLPASDRTFQQALESELERMRVFLGLKT